MLTATPSLHLEADDLRSLPREDPETLAMAFREDRFGRSRSGATSCGGHERRCDLENRLEGDHEESMQIDSKHAVSGYFYRGKGGVPVVLCSTFGYEELCIRANWRSLSESLSAAGHPVLRFDYPSAGDSADVDDAAILEGALKSIGSAIDWIKNATATSRVIVIGIRLGALFAATVAAQREDVASLVMIAPVENGRSFVRQVRMFAGVASSTRASEAGTAGTLRQNGFRFPGAFASALEKLSLANLPAPCANIMWLAAGRSEKLEALWQPGANVAFHEFPEQQSLFQDPMSAPLCKGMIDAIVAWTTPGTECAKDAESQVPTLSGPILGEHYVEQHVLFGGSQRLFGVLCEPSDQDVRGKACLFLNAGANYHIGWGRLYVDMARSLAERGVASFRMDFCGLGEAGPHVGDPDALAYKHDHIAQASKGVDVLYDQGYRDICVVGNCSGSYMALHAAVRDRRITSAVIGNLQAFHWEDSVRLSQGVARVKDPLFYARLLRDPLTWRRLFGGKVHLSTIAAGLIERFGREIANLAARFRPRADRSPSPREIVRGLASRGAKVAFVCSEDDTSISVLRSGLGHDLERILAGPNLLYAVLQGADHDLSNDPERLEFIRLVLWALT